jgi:hypothetical protein
MMTTEAKLEEIKRKMKRQLEKGQNCEKTNDIYRQFLIYGSNNILLPI